MEYTVWKCGIIVNFRFDFSYLAVISRYNMFLFGISHKSLFYKK